MPNALTGYYGGSVAARNLLAPPGFDWRTTALPTGPGGPAGPGMAADMRSWDPAKGTLVQMPDGSWQHFDTTYDANGNPLSPKTFISDSFPGGWAAANPGTPEFEHYANVMNTNTNQSALKIAALVGGAAALGSTAWGSGAAGTPELTASHTAIGTDTALGSAAGGGAGAGAGSSSGVLGSAGISSPTVLGSLVPGAGSAGGGMGLGLADWFNIGSTVLGAVGAKRSADAVSNASDAATAEQRREFDIAQGNLAPYQAAGVKALGNLQDPNANFLASPDYGFRRSEGQRDIGNSFAARGGAFSGNALKALTQYNQDLAQGEFGNWWNRQAGLAGVGQAATNNANALGANYAGNVGQNMLYGANARASGIQNTAGILAGGANNFATNYLYRQKYPGPYSPYQGYGG